MSGYSGGVDHLAEENWRERDSGKTFSWVVMVVCSVGLGLDARPQTYLFLYLSVVSSERHPFTWLGKKGRGVGFPFGGGVKYGRETGEDEKNAFRLSLRQATGSSCLDSFSGSVDVEVFRSMVTDASTHAWIIVMCK